MEVKRSAIAFDPMWQRDDTLNDETKLVAWLLLGVVFGPDQKHALEISLENSSWLSNLRLEVTLSGSTLRM